MKIISGELKGRNFYYPEGIRPTQNIVRKAVFDLIGHDLSGLTFLDLFAGSGAIGFEAISSGASKVTFVERDSKCFEVMQQNISHLKITPYINRPAPYELINNDAFASLKLLTRQKRKFDIIFADPPYGRELAIKTLNSLEAYDILQPTCVLIFQHDKREVLPEQEGRIIRFKQKTYGATVLSLYELKDELEINPIPD